MQTPLGHPLEWRRRECSALPGSPVPNFRSWVPDPTALAASRSPRLPFWTTLSARLSGFETSSGPRCGRNARPAAPATAPRPIRPGGGVLGPQSLLERVTRPLGLARGRGTRACVGGSWPPGRASFPKPELCGSSTTAFGREVRFSWRAAEYAARQKGPDFYSLSCSANGRPESQP